MEVHVCDIKKKNKCVVSSIPALHPTHAASCPIAANAISSSFQWDDVLQ
jgi:hypothetical protein